jgi:diaminopimelate decarboxylase
LESRFGFEPGEELASAFSRLDASPNCRVIGLHMHICTRDKSVQTHARLAVGMLEVARQLFPDRRPRYLNVGGGFFSSMEPFLREQFNCEVPDFESYAAAIAGPFAQTLGGGAVTTVLMLEPGLALVADAMSYCTQVTDVRKRNERRLALVAGTVYDIKLTLSQRNLPMQVIPKTSGEPGDEGLWDLTGYTCMEHDVLYRGYTGRLAPGDFVVFRNTGAYTLPLSPSFMRPRPAVVRLGANGGAEVLKRRESAGDALTTYNFP